MERRIAIQDFEWLSQHHRQHVRVVFAAMLIEHDRIGWCPIRFASQTACDAEDGIRNVTVRNDPMLRRLGFRMAACIGAGTYRIRWATTHKRNGSGYSCAGWLLRASSENNEAKENACSASDFIQHVWTTIDNNVA